MTRQATTTLDGSRGRRAIPPAKNLDSLDSVYDWFDDFYQADDVGAFDAFRRLRARGTVAHGLGMDFGDVVVPDIFNWHDRPSAMALTYAAVTQLLNTPDVFSHKLYASELGQENPLFKDGDSHRQFRRMVQEAFNPRAIKDWEALAKATANRLIDEFPRDATVDLVTQYCRRLPGEVFCQFIAAPPEMTERLAAWAIRQMHAFDAQAQEAIMNVHGYMAAEIADRRALSTDELAKRKDLVSLLARANVDGRFFNDVEIATSLHVLLIGGTDTAVKALASTFYFLLTTPGALERVRADRSLVPRAVEESLRLASPNVFGAARLATQDAVLDGELIKAGTAVMVNLTMANRDDSRWTNPDRFDLDRDQKAHVGFGYGPHTCIGMHLARLVMQSGINVLLDRMPQIRLDPRREPPSLRGVGSRAPSHVDVLLG